MNNRERISLIESVGEETIGDLESLLQKVPEPIVYDGFEPSGRMHIAQGLMRAETVNRFTQAGCKFVFWVADLFAMMNLKLDGNLRKIRTAGERMIKIWEACGMDMSRVEFRWASESISSGEGKYLGHVLDIAQNFTVSRLKRCSQIMGREESDELMGSQLFYPAMQAADVLHLNVHICSLGMDQRKVNMLVREYFDKKKRPPPVIVSHHMLLGLNGTKMSKSDPDNAIFMDDTPGEIKRKIRKAFCEPRNIEVNPIMEYIKYVIWPREKEFELHSKHDGTTSYSDFLELEKDFLNGIIHPSDLKSSTVTVLIRLLEPVTERLRQ